MTTLLQTGKPIGEELSFYHADPPYTRGNGKAQIQTQTTKAALPAITNR
jgi:hypothetical protein